MGTGRTLPVLLFALISGALHTGDALAAEPLSDEQLDAITAGAHADDLEEIVVQAAHRTARGKTVTAEGTLGISHMHDALAEGQLLLRDSAQSNLRSLVNLNAVQSVVSVLVNLNINIDSHVGELRQINLSSGAGR